MGGLMKEEDWVNKFVPIFILVTMTYVGGVAMNYIDQPAWVILVVFFTISIVIIVAFLVCTTVYVDKESLQVKARAKRKGNKLKFVYRFKNNTKSLVKIISYQLAVILGDKPQGSTHKTQCYWKVKPSWRKQTFETEWEEPKQFLITKDGEYDIDTHFLYYYGITDGEAVHNLSLTWKSRT